MSVPVIDYRRLRMADGARCCVCDQPIYLSDLAAQSLIALTGKKRDYFAHMRHFFTVDGQKQSPDYEANMRVFANAYVRGEGHLPEVEA